MPYRYSSGHPPVEAVGDEEEVAEEVPEARASTPRSLAATSGDRPALPGSKLLFIPLWLNGVTPEWAAQNPHRRCSQTTRVV